MDYIEMLDREFGRFYRLSREQLERAYRLALNELKDPMRSYLAVLGLISELMSGTATLKNNDKLSGDTAWKITQIIKS